MKSCQNVDLPEDRYDLIIVQWVAIYLTDIDFIDFFARCKKSLRKSNPKAIVLFKDNVTTTEDFLVDRSDSSIIRTETQYNQLFAAAGTSIVERKEQSNWPKRLLPTWMYALQ